MPEMKVSGDPLFFSEKEHVETLLKSIRENLSEGDLAYAVGLIWSIKKMLPDHGPENGKERIPELDEVLHQSLKEEQEQENPDEAKIEFLQKHLKE